MTKTQKFLRALDKASTEATDNCFYKDINFIDVGKRYFIRANTKNEKDGGQSIEWILFPKRDISKNGSNINVYTYFDIKDNEQLQILDKNIQALLMFNLERSNIQKFETISK
jgi:hypothetical protein